MTAQNKRIELHNKLKELCKTVYYSPPNGMQMSYPCFVYKLDAVSTYNADDLKYLSNQRYTVTYITCDPDDVMINEIFDTIKHSRFDRSFTTEGLYHNVFTIYI